MTSGWPDLAEGFPAVRYTVLSPEEAAELLRVELLWRYGVETYVSVGYGMAAVSVWPGLVVWTNGRWLRWSLGRLSAGGRPLYAVMGLQELDTAARRIARRYGELHEPKPEPGREGPDDLR